MSIEGSLLDDREVKDLLGDKAGTQRSRQQVIKAVSDRIDYVDENVRTVEKKVEGDEDKLEKLLIVSYPGEKTEEGLDFMEITEYLDEDDNIISMCLRTYITGVTNFGRCHCERQRPQRFPSKH